MFLARGKNGDAACCFPIKTLQRGSTKDEENRIDFCKATKGIQTKVLPLDNSLPFDSKASRNSILKRRRGRRRAEINILFAEDFASKLISDEEQQQSRSLSAGEIKCLRAPL
jgi:hypothetical protein